MNKGLLLSVLMFLMGTLLSVNAQNNGNNSDVDNTNPMESLYGEWWLVGWNNEGTWFEVDKNYVKHHSLSIEIPKEGYVMAYSMANEIHFGNLTLNGNEMIFTGGGGMTKVYCNVMENLFFEKHIIGIKSFQLEENQLRLYYTDQDYFVFAKVIKAQEPTVSNVQNSGCLRETRADGVSQIPKITLLKEGNVLSVSLLNYDSNCATEDFEITPTISNGSNGAPYTVSVKVKSIGENEADCICPYNISFTIHNVEANSFNFKCWWFNGQVNLTDGEQLVLSKEYYPEGTKWTEIRLDTLKYDSWYSKVGDEWVPNYETVEYYVKGTYENENWSVPFKRVYSSGPEWTDSLTLLLYEGTYYGYDMGVLATVPALNESGYPPYPGEAYYFDWNLGTTVRFVDILSNNTTGIYPPNQFDFGKIEEINEGSFGGIKPLKYTDVNGVRIIQGIGVTTWNDGECLFGPIDPYHASLFYNGLPYDTRHYRSKLVHFERNGEVLYNVWPGTPDNPSGIAEMKDDRVKTEKYTNEIYDLQGRKINSQLPKGIYIQNGKRFLVK